MIPATNQPDPIIEALRREQMRLIDETHSLRAESNAAKAELKRFKKRILKAVLR